jgi:outer membrane protein assembly factor BamE (lipoprotein component of BamABCDE complex)
MKIIRYMSLISIPIIVTFLILSCSSEFGRQFDETKTKLIEKGKTTQNQILEMFEKPKMKSYTSEGKIIWSYIYSIATVGKGITYEKSLTIVFNKENIVEDFIYKNIEE